MYTNEYGLPSMNEEDRIVFFKNEDEGKQELEEFDSINKNNGELELAKTKSDNNQKNKSLLKSIFKR